MSARLRTIRDFVGADGLAAALVVAGCASVPLLAGPGVESALCLGVLVPPFIASASAARAYGRDTPWPARTADATSRAMALWAAASGALLIRSLLGDACAPFAGMGHLLLGPLVGFLLAAILGVGVARVARSRRAAITIGALAPIGFVALGGYELFATPGVFLYSPFAGLLPGVLYDAGDAIAPAYLSYRLVTAAYLAALAIAVSAPHEPRRAKRRHLLAVGLLALGLYGTSRGAALGHRASAAVIDETLGARVYGARCVLHLPKETYVEERRLHARDCDFHVASLERYLGVRRETRVHVYLYRSADEKRRLMGAADTDVAKPWRGEAHLVREAYPHPVLRHELAHVLAAEMGRGPFRIAGSLGGLLPSPGLIEGLAVAASQEARDGLGPDAWSRAMLELGLLPRMQTLLGLGFLGEAPSTAYVASGSFLAFVRATEGPAAVRTAYRRGGFDAQTLVRLEAAWHRALRATPIPEDTLALARLRFERKGLFSAVCPHVMAGLRGELASARQSGDDRRVRAICARILAVDPSDAGARIAMIGALAREGRVAEAARLRDVLAAEPRMPTPYVHAAELAIADAALERGDLEAARTAYDRLLRAPLADDTLRVLEVKRLALDAPHGDRERIVAIVHGRRGRAASGVLAVHLAHGLAASRADGLGPYLVGRQLVNDARYADAIPPLREAERRGLPTARLSRENARLLALALDARGACAEAAERYARLATDPYARIDATLRAEAARACVARTR